MEKETIYLKVDIYQKNDNIEVTETRVSKYQRDINSDESKDDYNNNFPSSNTYIGVTSTIITKEDYDTLYKHLNSIKIDNEIVNVPKEPLGYYDNCKEKIDKISEKDVSFK